MHLFEHKPDTVINIEGDLVINFGEERPRKIKPTLVFNYFINNTNFNSMAVISSLTLTSTAPVTLNMTVIDQNGNQIAGTLSGLSYAVGDPTQDIAVVDPTVATEVDIHAVSLTGGTGVTPTGTFVSTAFQSDGVTPVLSGTVTGPALALTNAVVVPPTVTGTLVFNQ